MVVLSHTEVLLPLSKSPPASSASSASSASNLTFNPGMPRATVWPCGYKKGIKRLFPSAFADVIANPPVALGGVHTCGDITNLSEPQPSHLQSGKQNTAPTTSNVCVRLTKKEK